MKGGVEKNLHEQPQKRKGGGSAAPEPWEVCLRPSAIFADVAHAVGVADRRQLVKHACSWDLRW